MQPQSTVAADEFDPLNRRHIDVRHISNRWRQTYAPNGYSGLVVLAVVTRDRISPAVLANGLHPQHYVLALEQAVTHHFALVECDPRVANETFCAGNLEKRGAPAYVVYVAFKTDISNTVEKENAVPVAPASPVAHLVEKSSFVVPASPAAYLTPFPVLAARGVTSARGGKGKNDDADTDFPDLSSVAACLAEPMTDETDEFYDAHS